MQLIMKKVESANIQKCKTFSQREKVNLYEFKIRRLVEDFKRKMVDPLNKRSQLKMQRGHKKASLQNKKTGFQHP